MNTQGKFISAWSTVASSTAGASAVVATKDAGGARLRHFITGFAVSCGAAPATAVSVTISTVGESETAMDQVELPAAQFAPVCVNYNAPLMCDVNQGARIRIAAVGGSTRATVTIRGFTVYE